MVDTSWKMFCLDREYFFLQLEQSLNSLLRDMVKSSSLETLAKFAFFGHVDLQVNSALSATSGRSESSLDIAKYLSHA